MKPYYQEPGITLYCGDCREILPQLGPVDLVLTDPPYGVNLGDHGGANDGRTDHVLVKGRYESYNDTLDNLRAVVVPAITAAIAKSARGIVFCAGQHVGEFPKPSALGGIYFPAAQGRNCWGFASLACAMLYGKGYRLEKGSRATVYSSVEASEKKRPSVPEAHRLNAVFRGVWPAAPAI